MGMKEEMADEWLELAVDNIHKLIPADWMPRINEILPKILKIVKIGLKRHIKTTAEQLGDNKMILMLNTPYVLEDGSQIMVPTCIKIDKSQLGESFHNKEDDTYELRLKPGQVPEYEFSMLTLISKLDKYEKIDDLIKDLKNGTFITLQDIRYTGDHSAKVDTSINPKQLEAGS